METLLVFALVLAVGATVLTVLAIGDGRLRRRVQATRTSRIAEAPGGGTVEIVGRAAPGPQGAVVAPCSGRAVVWVTARVYERRRRKRRSVWRRVFDVTSEAPFLLDDGSGHPCLVRPKDARTVVAEATVAEWTPDSPRDPRLVAFLAAHGVGATTWTGATRRLRFVEERIEIGEEVYALGPARREGTAPVSDGYRTVHAPQLVLARADGPEGELVLTNKSEAALVDHLTGARFGAVVVWALAVLLAGAAGIVALAR